LYEKFYALDACMKLSVKDGKTKRSQNDPELLPGCGVFVHNEEYLDCLKRNAKVPQVYIHVQGDGLDADDHLGEYSHMRKRVPCCEPSKESKHQSELIRTA
jgi:hypothetical protein